MIDVYQHIGKVVANKVGAEPVSVVGIRRYLEAHQLNIPIYFDEAAAKEAGHTGIVAPWSMLLTMAMSAYWSPGDPPLPPMMLPPFYWTSIVPEGWEAMTNRVEVEYFEEMHLGDIIHSEYKITAVTPKRTKVGEGEFVDFEVTFRNQHGVLIAIERTAVYRYKPFPVEGANGHG